MDTIALFSAVWFPLTLTLSLREKEREQRVAFCNVSAANRAYSNSD